MKEYKILCMHPELNLEFFVFHKKWGQKEKGGSVGVERTSTWKKTWTAIMFTCPI